MNAWLRLLPLCPLMALVAVSVHGVAPSCESNMAHGGKSEGVMFCLDLTHGSLSQSVVTLGGAAEKADFVRVEVAQVINPKRYGLLFEVAYQPPGKQGVHLGEFSLYPADNPGTFLVPSRGLLGRSGSIVVSMSVTDPVEAGTPLKVFIRTVSLIRR